MLVKKYLSFLFPAIPRKTQNNCSIADLIFSFSYKSVPYKHEINRAVLNNQSNRGRTNRPQKTTVFQPSTNHGRRFLRHLHLHTCYSLLDSTLKIKEALASARDMGMNYLAMTDHAVLYGAVGSIAPPSPPESSHHRLRCLCGTKRYRRTENATRQHEPCTPRRKSNGYQNLVKLVSRAHLEGMYYKPRIDKEMLREYAEGLIGLSGNLRGEVNEACRDEDLERAEKLALEYADILGPNNFFLELMDHGEEDEKIANRNLIFLAQKTGLPLVATNDVHYVRQEHAEAHDVLTCLQRGTLVADPNRYRYPGDQFYLKALRKWKPSPNSPKPYQHH